MKKSVQALIRSENLFTTTDQLLLGVSGGKDSMAMAHLMLELGYSIAIAHVNYQLRGIDSNKDENLVKDFAKSLRVPFFLKKLERNELAGTGIQQNARKIRYQYFEEIAKKDDFDLILTAHHRDDLIETVLLNFLRGAGPDGMAGIRAKRGIIRRPLLNIKSEEIHQYVKKHKIPWREDVSNAESKYYRNFIRNELIPLIESRWPACKDTIHRHSEIMQEMVNIRNLWLKVETPKIKSIRNTDLLLDLNKIKNSIAAVTLLKNELGNIQTDYAVLKDMLKNHQTGKQWLSNDKEYVITLEPGEILSCRKNTPVKEFKPLTFELKEGRITTGLGTLIISKPNSKEIPKGTNHLSLKEEYKNRIFTIRKWMPGDYFHPIGMKGKRKKIKKYLTDLKLGKRQKENVLLLTQKDNVVWVIGFRGDDRFGMEKTTDEKGIMLEWKTESSQIENP